MTTDSNETTLAGITGIRTVGVPVTHQDLAVDDDRAGPGA